MRVEMLLGAGMSLALLLGCSSDDDAGKLPDASTTDAIPSTSFVLFTSKTWSLAANGIEHQLVITDRPNADGCALASDQHTKSAGAGVEIVIHLPVTSSDKCPTDQSHQLMNCVGVSPGTDAFVTKGCAYYRKFDDAGNVIGEAAASNGVLTINGSASSCAIRASLGFVGAAFSESFALDNGTGAEPWCRTSTFAP